MVECNTHTTCSDDSGRIWQYHCGPCWFCWSAGYRWVRHRHVLVGTVVSPIIHYPQISPEMGLYKTFQIVGSWQWASHIMNVALPTSNRMASMSKAVSSFSRWPETQCPEKSTTGLNQTSRYGKTEAINGQAHGLYFFWTQIFDFEPFRSMPVNRIDGSEPELERHWFEFSWKWSACRSHASKSQEQCTGRAAWGSSQRTCWGNAKMVMGQKLVQNSPRITEAWDFFLEDTTLLNGHNWGRVTIPSHVVGH